MSVVNPIVSAGTDQAVTDSQPITLVGIVQEGSYSLNGVLWTLVSGPDCAMTNAASWVNKVFEVSAGTYVFRLTAYDILGNSSTDDVSVTVTHENGPVYISDSLSFGNTNTFAQGDDGVPPTDFGL